MLSMKRGLNTLLKTSYMLVTSCLTRQGCSSCGHWVETMLKIAYRLLPCQSRSSRVEGLPEDGSAEDEEE
jgi:hypothetical protein